MIRLKIDDQWVDAVEADPFGVIGRPLRCDYSSPEQGQDRRILIRRIEWPQEGAEGAVPVVLQLDRRDLPSGIGVTVTKDDSCIEVIQQNEVPSSVYRQDVTGCRPLRDTLRRCLESTQYSEALDLVRYGREALRKYTAAAGSTVPLLVPTGLVVLPNRQFAHLDALFVLRVREPLMARDGPLVPPGGPAASLYSKWFGTAGQGGTADLEKAHRLHDLGLANLIAEESERLTKRNPPVPRLQRDAAWAQVEKWFDVLINPPQPETPKPVTPPPPPPPPPPIPKWVWVAAAIAAGIVFLGVIIYRVSR
jgi:hypothetical protein